MVIVVARSTQHFKRQVSYNRRCSVVRHNMSEFINLERDSSSACGRGCVKSPDLLSLIAAQSSPPRDRILTFPRLMPGMPSWARQCWQARSPQDKAMATPSFQGKSGCGKLQGQEPAVREPFPACSLVRGSAVAPAVPAQGKMRGEVIGGHRLLGLGGWEGRSSVPLPSGCLQSSSMAAEAVALYLCQHSCLRPAQTSPPRWELHTQSAAVFGKDDFHSCTTIR